MCWNYMGTTRKSFISLMNDGLREYKVCFLFILETHVSGERKNHIMNRFKLKGHYIVEGQGHSSGIWCPWYMSSFLWKSKLGGL